MNDSKVYCKNKNCITELVEGAAFCHVCGKDQRAKSRKKTSDMHVPEPVLLPSGTWRIQLRLGKKSIPVTANPNTPDEVKRMARLIKAEYKAGKLRINDVDNITLREACTQYIESRRSRRSPRTIEEYEKIVKNSFQTIMDKNLKLLTHKVLDTAISDECKRISRRKKPVSSKTVTNSFMLILSALKYHKITFEDKFDLPEVKKKPVQILPPEDIYNAVAGSDIELPCLLSMWLTLSTSEIRGLTKSKSIRNGQITTVETVVDVYGEPVRKDDSKEEERARTQNIPPYIKSLIDAVDGDVICDMKSVKLNKRLQILLKKQGLPVINFHKLRHVAASVMSKLKIQKEIIKEKGGWMTDYTLDNVYIHTFTDERINADAIVDEYYTNIVNNNKVKSLRE